MDYAIFTILQLVTQLVFLYSNILLYNASYNLISRASLLSLPSNCPHVPHQPPHCHVCYVATCVSCEMFIHGYFYCARHLVEFLMKEIHC